MTLTEQWKKGELPEGYYYFKMPDGAIEIASEYRLIRYNLTKDAEKIEVLAPVPSYEEWQELKEASDGLSKLMFKSLMNRFVKADEERERFSEENQQLKELLKQWLHFYPIVLYEYEDTLKTKDIVELYEKTANAIGEKK